MMLSEDIVEALGEMRFSDNESQGSAGASVTHCIVSNHMSSEVAFISRTSTIKYHNA